MAPLKKDWVNIYGPLVDMMKLQVRMNPYKRQVEIRSSKHTKDSGSLQKGADFVKAYSLGFDVDVSELPFLKNLQFIDERCRMPLHSFDWTTYTWILSKLKMLKLYMVIIYLELSVELLVKMVKLNLRLRMHRELELF